MNRQVAPAEIEEILFKHPDVREAAVVGVPHVEYGEAARAFVVLSDDIPSAEVTERELRQLITGDYRILVLFFLS